MGKTGPIKTAETMKMTTAALQNKKKIGPLLRENEVIMAKNRSLENHFGGGREGERERER